MSGDHVPSPYTRQEIHRAKIISVSAIPQTVAARQAFKASHFQGEWLKDTYVVWLAGVTPVAAWVDEEWFAADIKLRFGEQSNREMWDEFIRLTQPKILKTPYIQTVILHGKAGVVRRMMGLI